MLTTKTVENAAKKFIEMIEDLGEKSGSSGHLGFKSFVIDSIEQNLLDPTQEPPKFRIQVSYRIIIETEFTFYPDNPPHEYPKSTTFILDENGGVLPSPSE